MARPNAPTVLYASARSSATKELVVQILQERGSCTATDLADICGVTDAALRQHLEQLERLGVVERLVERVEGHRGRPPITWTLSAARRETTDFPTLFPDRHRELAAHLLTTIRDSLGEAALDRVLERRIADQSDEYRHAMKPSTDLRSKVRILAELRDSEGYRSEAVDNHDGSFTLVEHHCAIDDAARHCRSLCDAEARVFTEVLGPSVDVHRTAHVLAGDGRCAYRIAPRRISLRRPRRPASPE